MNRLISPRRSSPMPCESLFWFGVLGVASRPQNAFRIPENQEFKSTLRARSRPSGPKTGPKHTNRQAVRPASVSKQHHPPAFT